MGWTVERLRVAIVAIAAFLLLAIFGFSLYSRWRAEHLAQDLPARLGLKIQQSTQGFVLSKTEQGRTIFTLHATRALAFKFGGRVLLHNVEIDVYNQDGQVDTIAGKDFQYDRNSQVVESQGEAHIALHAPQNATASGTHKDAGKMIRVTTHGLIFNQKTGVATCSGEVDFHIASSNGQAIGAEYDSRQGHLLLQSQVVLTTMQNRPAVVHAARAVYDRNDDRVVLQQPRYSSATQRGNQVGSAATATVFLRADGSAKRLDAQGEVQLASSDGDTIRASSMQAALNGSSRPQHVHFIGHVQFAQKQPGQVGSGSADDALVDFNSEGHAQRAIFDRDVRFHQQQKVSNTSVLRSLRSQHLDLHLVPQKTGQSQLQAAEATGDAVFRSQSSVAGSAPQTTRISGQTLKARFLSGNQIEHMDGSGQTEVQTVGLNGDVNTSSGDTLHIDFATGLPTGPAGKRPSSSGTGKMTAVAAHPKAPTMGKEAISAQSIRYAVQTGHVVLQQTSKRTGSAAAPQISTATAMRAAYRADTDTVTLIGEPVFHDSQMELAANTMQVQRATEKVTAMGAVRGSLRPGAATENPLHQAADNGLLSGGSQPVHIIATRAVLLRDSQKAIFTGHARLWQGGDTVEAPVIEISQRMQTLLAYSDGPCSQCVHSVFTGQPAQPKSVSPAKTAERQVRRLVEWYMRAKQAG